MRISLLVISLAIPAGCSKTDNTPSPLSLTLEKFDFPNTGISGSIKFDKYPPVIDINAPFTIRFWKTATGSSATGPFIDPGFTLNNKTVDLWMPGHRHGWDKIIVTKQSDDPKNPDTTVSFHADNVKFFMPREWQIRVVFADSTGNVVDSVAIPYFQQ